MPDQSVTCPKCGHAFEVAQALTAIIETRLRGELAAAAREQAAARERQHAEALEAVKVQAKRDAEAKAAAAAEEKLARLQGELQERVEKLAAARAREADLLKKARALEDEKAELDNTVARRVAEERRGLLEAAEKRLREQHQQKDLEKDQQLAALSLRVDKS